jgi:hypothetical protein
LHLWYQRALLSLATVCVRGGFGWFWVVPRGAVDGGGAASIKV